MKKISGLLILITTSFLLPLSYLSGANDDKTVVDVRGLPENLDGNSKILHIQPHRLDQMEDLLYATYLKEGFEKAKLEGYDLVVVEIDTPGGELAATLEIKNLILSSDVDSLCYVNKNAISAGSLIAISCNSLVMAPGSVIGAATPVFSGEKGMEKAPEKVVSATRAAWRGAAEARGRDPEIAEAFVDENIELERNGKRPAKKKGTLLTLTGQEAVDIDFADAMAENINKLWEKIGVKPSQVTRFESGFKYQFLSFFLSPVISGILIGLGIMGIVYELKMPGWGVSGTLGLIFLILYFITRIMVGYSGWGPAALFAFSVLLILLELFVIPGFGIAGITGFSGLVASILWSYGINDLEEGLVVIFIALLFLVIGTTFIVKRLPALAAQGRTVFLNTVLPDDKTTDNYQQLLGKTAITKTALRPSGKIMLEQHIYDVVAEGEFIDPGTKVVVERIEGNRIVVTTVET